MRTPPLVLVADDNAMNVEILKTRLSSRGYAVITAADGEETLTVARAERPDLILLDVMMPKMDGFDVCRHLKADASLPFMPVVMVTAKADTRDIVEGLDAGADEYLTKPVDQASMLARVRSMLRIKALHDTVQHQAAALEEWNRDLSERVKEQVAELERVGRLKRFFSPQLAELIVAGGTDDPLRSHRREITVVFIDLRGFTAFTETAEPEEIMAVLRQYHAECGRLILAHEGTLERFTGDGMMIFFNDPVEVPNPAERAVRLAVAIRACVADMAAGWHQQGYHLELGIGVAEGYATIGAIGFEGRWDYGAIGPVTNLAARLCGEAQPGQILVSPRVRSRVEDILFAEELPPFALKGFARPITAYNVTGLTLGASR